MYLLTLLRKKMSEIDAKRDRKKCRRWPDSYLWTVSEGLSRKMITVSTAYEYVTNKGVASLLATPLF